MLVVLDNAANAEQVRSLLPGSPGSLVVLTSRDRLTGLMATHGVHRLTLGVLTPAESAGLVVGAAGAPASAQLTEGLPDACFAW